MLISFIARKMQQDGFYVISFDDDNSLYNECNFPRPPSVLRHRPDIIGRNTTGNFAIGEAKTKNDLNGNRIKEQINDFSNLLNNDNTKMPFYMSIPESCDMKLKKIVADLKIDITHMITIKIPDVLLG